MRFAEELVSIRRSLTTYYSNVILLELRLIEITNRRAIDEAKQIAINFDLDDYPFIALALELNAIIWTNNKEF